MEEAGDSISCQTETKVDHHPCGNDSRTSIYCGTVTHICSPLRERYFVRGLVLDSRCSSATSHGWCSIGLEQGARRMKHSPPKGHWFERFLPAGQTHQGISEMRSLVVGHPSNGSFMCNRRTCNLRKKGNGRRGEVLAHVVGLRFLSGFVLVVASAHLGLLSVDAFVCRPTPVRWTNRLVTPTFTSIRSGGGTKYTRAGARYSQQKISSTKETQAAPNSKSSTRQDAKDTFLRKLDRKKAGESIPTKVLDTDVSDLVRLSETTDEGRYSWTTVGDLASWRGTWKICHAPHIETLGGLLATSFPSVEYDFTADDGRMVSHSRYESPLFGSGWLNADGRVVDISPPSGERGAPAFRVVQVVFERFWWDKNGEEKPTKAPPTSTLSDGGGKGVGGDLLASFVQAAGKALFIKGLSIFPVLYLDDDLCIFEFKAAGTVVASQRI